MSDITGAVTQSGFQITELTEPRPSRKASKKYPELAYRQTIPMSFFIKAVKPDN